MTEILTSKEKEQIASLEKNFNLVQENKNYNYLASRRADISRVWSKKLLKASMVLNILSVIILSTSFIISLRKPPPEFYASTPSGKIYYMKKIG